MLLARNNGKHFHMILGKMVDFEFIQFFSFFLIFTKEFGSILSWHGKAYSSNSSSLALFCFDLHIKKDIIKQREKWNIPTCTLCLLTKSNLVGSGCGIFTFLQGLRDLEIFCKANTAITGHWRQDFWRDLKKLQNLPWWLLWQSCFFVSKHSSLH